MLADEIGRQALNCIRCSACLNVCPVYERTGGHAYGSTYPGPIGAILTPMLTASTSAASLPYASSLCGACYEVCPVKINIPEVLVHLRGEVVRQARRPPDAEHVAMRALARVFANRRLYEAAQRPAGSGSGRWCATGRSSACPGRWPAGRRRATCRPCRARASASGGASVRADVPDERRP